MEVRNLVSLISSIFPATSAHLSFYSLVTLPTEKRSRACYTRGGKPKSKSYRLDPSSCLMSARGSSLFGKTSFKMISLWRSLLLSSTWSSSYNIGSTLSDSLLRCCLTPAILYHYIPSLVHWEGWGKMTLATFFCCNANKAQYATTGINTYFRHHCSIYKDTNHWEMGIVLHLEIHLRTHIDT